MTWKGTDKELNSISERVDLFIPTLGQTIFLLSEDPNESVPVEMFINGLNCDSFTISGRIITYTGTNYILGTTDLIKLIY